jgi:cell division protein FtsN
MAKDYGRKPSRPHKGSFSKQLMLVLVSFLLGYLSALTLDFSSLSKWVNAQLAQNSSQIIAKSSPQQAQLPKPKFEFYTLLASEHAPEEGQAARPNPTAQVAATQLTAQPITQPIQLSGPTVKVQPTLPVPVEIVAAKPLPIPIVSPISASKGAYLVQLGSFRSKQEAERMKAALALKGFVVNVAPVTQQNTNWYRVVLGPYPSRIEAKKAQGSVARSEHIVGMIRKMDA